MKKIVISFIIVFICVFLVGCNDFVDAYYFSFLRDEIHCFVGDSIKIFNLETKTNITSYEHMHIYTNEGEIVSVDNETFSIKTLKEGEATIFVGGRYNNDYIVDSIVINVSSININNSQGGASSSITAELLDVFKVDNKNLLIYDIKFNNQDYVDFKYEILQSSNCDYKISLYSHIMQIEYDDGCNITIKIIDNKNQNNFYILNLN